MNVQIRYSIYVQDLNQSRWDRFWSSWSLETSMEMLRHLESETDENYYLRSELYTTYSKHHLN